MGYLVTSKGVSQLKLVNGTINRKAYLDNFVNNIKLHYDVPCPEASKIITYHAISLQTIRAFIRDQGSDRFDWSFNSPDLSPIETVWTIVKRHVGQMPNKRDIHLAK